MKNVKFISLCFIIYGFLGCGDLTGVADKVLVPPIAVAGDDVTIKTDANVTLNARKSSDKDGSIIAYSWEENGTILSTGIELKEYSSKIPGNHIITLKILDNDELNASDTINVFVILENQTPLADAGVDEKMRVGERITLDGSASYDSDGEIVLYEWKKKDSSEVLSTGVKLKNYTPTTEEIHIIQLKVTDNGGLSHIDYVFISVLNNKIPLANAGNDQSVIAGELITLDGNMSHDLDGNIILYSWEENNTILSTGVNLIDYSSVILGEHNITLTVTDNDGNSDSDIVVITVYAENIAPVANAGDNKNIRVNESVILEGNTSTDSDGSIAAYLWKEGNLTLGTGSNLNYSTGMIGAHIVELTVTDNEGLTHTDTTTVTVVGNTSPLANAGNDQTIRIGQSITLDGISNDNDGTMISYEWRESGTLLGTAEDLVNYTFTTLGTHTIIYTVTDNDGITNSDTVVVTVLASNVAPVANAGDNKNIRVNEFVILDGSASFDSDGSIAAYLWKEGVPSLGTGSSLNYSTGLVGAHIVELTVTDNEGLTHTDTTTVTVVGNTSPLANAGNDQTIRIGQSITLDGIGNDVDGSIVGYEWREGSIVLGTAEDLVNYTFTTLGTHTIIYTVTDNNGLTNSDTVLVTVLASNVAPVANAGDNQSVVLLQDLILDGSASSDSDGTIIAYEWTEGGVILGTAATLTYSSAYLGGHTILLKVRDNEGLENTDSVYITVTN